MLKAYPTADLSTAKALPNNQYSLVPQLWINYYTMNYLVKPFDNIHIRQAFALAINKDLIVHSVWKDTVIATNHIVPKGMPGYNPNLTAPDGVTGTSGDTDQGQGALPAGNAGRGMDERFADACDQAHLSKRFSRHGQ